MKYYGFDISSDFEMREMPRGEDLDLFIPTEGIPLNLEIEKMGFSRIQFPNTKAVLIRLSPKSERITCHILKDIDLFSSFANFEVAAHTIQMHKKEHYIQLRFR